jgi:hypothetical protein
MSDVATRPTHSRGRTSARGGRGGHRGVNRPRAAHAPDADDSFNDANQGQLGELKKKYISELATLRELFADWNDVDLVLALEETSGDLERTIEHISEGNVCCCSLRLLLRLLLQQSSSRAPAIVVPIATC